jgi:hypothetical protein
MLPSALEGGCETAKYHPARSFTLMRMLTPEQTRSYLPQDGYEQELTCSYKTGQVLNNVPRWFVPTNGVSASIYNHKIEIYHHPSAHTDDC